MWYRIRRKRRRATSVTKHYQVHKETAREVIVARLEHFNQYYQLPYKRVAIRNQRRCWGSCSELGNLNFSYKLLFLPACLRDYIVVHELCHLKELNHGPQFWALVGEVLPEYKALRRELRRIERTVGTAAGNLEKETASHTCAQCVK